MADPCIGCGFEINPVTGDLELQGARQVEWPFAFDIEDCNGLRCDPVTGNVWAAPPRSLVRTGRGDGIPLNFQSQLFTVYAWDIDTVSLAANPASPWNTPGADITSIASVTLTNPNACRDMLYWFSSGVGSITTALDSGVSVDITASLQVNGGGFVGLGFTNSFRGDNTAPLTLDQVANQNGVLISDPFITTATTLAPGASVTIDAKLSGALLNPTATPSQQVVIGGGITISMWGQSL